MIDSTFVDKILELAKVENVAIEGREYTSKPLHAVKRPMPKTFGVTTLTAIKDYLQENPDDLALESLILHVISPTEVILFSSLDRLWADRCEFLAASPVITPYGFGHWMGLEEFVIALQAQFIQEANVASVLKIVGNIQDGRVNNFTDDGVTQGVTAKSGIVRLENVPVPNPIKLQPYRTFMEIEQPASKFVLRIKSQGPDRMPLCALFEADGGAWQQEAILNVKEWLQANVGVELESLSILA